MEGKIEWTESTWNPVRRCTRVWVMEKLDDPLRWLKPRRVLVNSMSDLFHPGVPDEFLDRIFGLMALCQKHTFLLPTKRPERAKEYLSLHGRDRLVRIEAHKIRARETCPLWPLPNVWMGTSVEDQKAADQRIPLLLETPAAVRWISAEPLLGPVDLSVAACTGWVGLKGLLWVVVGGESGPGARPMHADWARSLRDQCQGAGVPFLFKQHGDWIHVTQTPMDPIKGQVSVADLALREIFGCRSLKYYTWPDGSFSRRLGRKEAGRHLDGRIWNEYPEAR